MLAVAMGIGRFAYTPLLPIMERDAGLTVSMAGTLAFSNLFGYLVGASLAMMPLTHRRRVPIARSSLACIVLTTALMAWISPLWIPLRFLTGVSSGFVLIFASSIVLERAARRKEQSWAPLMFSGVGIGIAFSGIAVPAFAAIGGSRAAWIGIAIASALAIAATTRWFRDEAPAAPVTASTRPDCDGSRKGTFAWLIAVYTIEAFAYVIPATFLVAIASHVPSIARFAAASWIVAGIAGAGANFGWIAVGNRVGKTRALAIALALQAMGIAAPAISNSAIAVVLAAIGLGATFIAITLFATGIARDLFPRRTSAAVSRLTMFYSIGQMIGPLVATGLALRFGSYGSALLCAAAVAAVASICTLVTIPKIDARN